MSIFKRRESGVSAKWYRSGDKARLLVKSKAVSHADVHEMRSTISSALMSVGVPKEQAEVVQLGWENNAMRGFGVAELPLTESTISRLCGIFREIKGVTGFDVGRGLGVACRG